MKNYKITFRKGICPNLIYLLPTIQINKRIKFKCITIELSWIVFTIGIKIIIN